MFGRNSSLDKALWAGLDAAAPDKESWKRGEAAFRRNIADGKGNEASFLEAMTEIAPDTATWEAGERAFRNSLSQSESDRSFSVGKVLKWLLIIALIGLIGGIIWTSVHQPDSSKKTVGQATTEDIVSADLVSKGWDKDKFVLGDKVDPTLDKSDAGQGAFSQKGIKSPAAMIDFLKTKSTEANMVKKAVMDTTGATEADVMNVSKWVAVQSLVDFEYPGNTWLDDGKQAAAGTRKAEAGEIFLAFAGPKGVFYVRGACSNPQTIAPTVITKTVEVPVTVTKTVEKVVTKIVEVPKIITKVVIKEKKKELEQKDPSKDPAAQGNAPEGGGKNEDPGPGNYVPPSQMQQPPSTSYAAPAAPTTTSEIPAGSTPDTSAAPAAESGAPTSSAPAEEYSAPPGM